MALDCCCYFKMCIRDSKTLCADGVEKAAVKSYDELKQAHIKDYNTLYNRCLLYTSPKQFWHALSNSFRRLRLLADICRSDGWLLRRKDH